jgi:hypothetical protein
MRGECHPQHQLHLDHQRLRPCRKIAGLERLVLNANQAWRPSKAARSMDLEDLDRTGPPHSPTTSTATSGRGGRMSVITQSMPAFNRDILQQMHPGQSHRGGAALSPLPPTPEGIRPGTAAPRARRPALTNPRSPASLQLLDCFITPEVRSRIQQFNGGGTPSGAGAGGSIKAVQSHDMITLDGDDLVEQGSFSCATGGIVQKGAVEDLMAEVRNARFAGHPGEDSEHLRLARLELKLKTLQVHSFGMCVCGCVCVCVWVGVCVCVCVCVCVSNFWFVQGYVRMPRTPPPRFTMVVLNAQLECAGAAA